MKMYEPVWDFLPKTVLKNIDLKFEIKHIEPGFNNFKKFWTGSKPVSSRFKEKFQTGSEPVRKFQAGSLNRFESSNRFRTGSEFF